MSYVKVSITTPYGAARKLNQSAPFPVERVVWAGSTVNRVRVGEKQGGNRERRGERLKGCKIRLENTGIVPICFEIALWDVVGHRIRSHGSKEKFTPEYSHL